MDQTPGLPFPQQARDAIEFIDLMRALKERSGFTYRQLEERAAARGEVLARSTLAGVLGGRTLPRPELLAVFVRACGDGERTGEWLQAWGRLAGAAAEPPAGPAVTAATDPAPVPPAAPATGSTGSTGPAPTPAVPAAPHSPAPEGSHDSGADPDPDPRNPAAAPTTTTDHP
ncbi:helix-turn-helix domain-containing protein [Streptomyces sp. NPDC097619]|uniref:helix-turn-helix domain-containing protein n=1 Tax=Streptomyces sp. NPDC097619 TaxID=3157228 RepID=UPI00331EB473